MDKRSKKNKKEQVRLVYGTATSWLFSERIDPWVTHRLSMLTMSLLLCGFYFFGWGELKINEIESISLFAIFQALINWPHFMVSYKVLYVDYGDWRKYNFAMVKIPILLVAVWAVAVYLISTGRMVLANNYAYLVWVVAAFYLAWHYVGQAWGTISLGLLQSKCQSSVLEINILRSAVKVMIAWHAVWAMQQVGDIPVLSSLKSPTMMSITNVVAVASLFVCLIIFLQIYKRQGLLHEKVWGPLLLLYLWYFVLWVQPIFALFIQLSHALQYLIFPAKVQISQHKEQVSSEHFGKLATNPWIKLGGTYLICVFAGWLIFSSPIYFFPSHQNVLILAGLMASLINIHHYFTDGAIWKLRDERVRHLLLKPISGSA